MRWQQSATQRSWTVHKLARRWSAVKHCSTSLLTTSNLFLCKGQVALQHVEQISLSVCLPAQNWTWTAGYCQSDQPVGRRRAAVATTKKVFPFKTTLLMLESEKHRWRRTREGQSRDRDCAIDLSSFKLLPPSRGRREEMGGSTTGSQQQSRAHAGIPH